MESFGSYLKNAREAKKVSLPAISRATRIRRVILEDIERDRGSFLLPEVVIKNFIEAYARCVGLNPKEALARYAQWRKANRASPPEETPVRGEPKVPRRFIVAGAGALVVIILFSLLLFTGHSQQEAQQQTVPTRGTTGQKKAAPLESPRTVEASPAATMQTPPPATRVTVPPIEKAPVPAGREHILVIKASERTWIQIQEGSSAPLDVILYAGDSYTRKSSFPLAILIGNASGVQVIFDDKVLEGLGGAGEVVRIKLPRAQEG
jgi:cytoskeletal protein RodZ